MNFEFPSPPIETQSRLLHSSPTTLIFPPFSFSSGEKKKRINCLFDKNFDICPTTGRDVISEFSIDPNLDVYFEQEHKKMVAARVQKAMNNQKYQIPSIFGLGFINSFHPQLNKNEDQLKQQQHHQQEQRMNICDINLTNESIALNSVKKITPLSPPTFFSKQKSRQLKYATYHYKKYDLPQSLKLEASPDLTDYLAKSIMTKKKISLNNKEEEKKEEKSEFQSNSENIPFSLNFTQVRKNPNDVGENNDYINNNNLNEEGDYLINSNINENDEYNYEERDNTNRNSSDDDDYQSFGMDSESDDEEEEEEEKMSNPENPIEPSWIMILLLSDYFPTFDDNEVPKIFWHANSQDSVRINESNYRFEVLYVFLLDQILNLKKTVFLLPEKNWSQQIINSMEIKNKTASEIMQAFNNNQMIRRIVKLFEGPHIKESILKEVLRELFSFREARKKNSHQAYRQVRNITAKRIFSILAWALQNEGILQLPDVRLLIIDPVFYQEWNCYFARETKLMRDLQEAKMSYVPWLVTIQRFIRRMRTSSILLNKLSKKEQNFCQNVLVGWLSEKNMINLIAWINQFIWTDYVKDKKRKMLYLSGDTHLGKTTFIDLLFLPFKKISLETDFYTSQERGEQVANILIFDDPAKIGEKNWHNLQSNFWLRAATGGKKNQTITIQTKGGFVKFHKAQLVLISNETIQQLVLDTNNEDAYLARVLPISIHNTCPFPLSLDTAETHIFMLEKPPVKKLILEDHDDEKKYTVRYGDSNIQQEFYNLYNNLPQDIPNLKKRQKLNKSDLYNSQNFQRLNTRSITYNNRKKRYESPFFNEEVLACLIWEAIFEIFDWNLRKQKSQDLLYYFDGDADFISFLLKDKSQSNLIDQLLKIPKLHEKFVL